MSDRRIGWLLPAAAQTVLGFIAILIPLFNKVVGTPALVFATLCTSRSLRSALESGQPSAPTTNNGVESDRGSALPCIYVLRAEGGRWVIAKLRRLDHRAMKVDPGCVAHLSDAWLLARVGF